MHKRKIPMRAAALLCAALLLAMAGCSAANDPAADGSGNSPDTGAEYNPELQRYNSSFLELFDTVTTVVGYAESEEAFSAEINEFHDMLEEYHQLYDIYSEYEGINNIKTINDNAGGEPVEVDQRIIDLLLFAQDMYARTGGKTNVMMGSALRLWHDAREYGINNPEDSYLPDEAELEAANEHTSIEALVIDDEANTVQITDPLASLDVGAVAKGYAVQRVCDEMPSGLLVSVGGNVCATGPRPTDGSDWIVGVQDPDGGVNDYLLTVNLGTGSIVSSGDYQRYYTVDGVRYSHIIDPATLFPPTYWRAVSIVCDDSGEGDALSTALFCMTQEEGQAVLDEFGAKAVWIAQDGSLVYSEGFEELINEVVA